MIEQTRMKYTCNSTKKIKYHKKIGIDKFPRCS